MRSVFHFAFCALAAVAAAQTYQNPFKVPSSGYSFAAGSPTQLSWTPTTSGTVSLILQWGSVTTSSGGITIASHISNSGSFMWTPPASLPARSDYTIEIIDDSNPSDYNFTPRFSVAGVTGIASSSGAVSSTGTPLSSPSASSTMMSTTMSSSTSTRSSAASSSASTTGSSSASSSARSTAASYTSTSNPTSNTATPTSVPNLNGGVANKVSGGLMVVALGAFALM